MAIKVELAAALLVALMALAGATTSVDDEAKESRRQQCIEQFRRRTFFPCQYVVLDVTNLLPATVTECCNQPRQVEGCGCEAIRYTVGLVQRRAGSPQVYPMAPQLPRICNFKEQQTCVL